MEPPEISSLPIELTLVLVAVFGGIARYLNGYINGQGFKLTVFVASVIVSGFGGLMFGWLGHTLAMAPTTLLIMAGMGGYFSEQTLKLVFDIIKARTK